MDASGFFCCFSGRNEKDWTRESGRNRAYVPPSFRRLPKLPIVNWHDVLICFGLIIFPFSYCRKGSSSWLRQWLFSILSKSWSPFSGYPIRFWHGMHYSVKTRRISVRTQMLLTVKSRHNIHSGFYPYFTWKFHFCMKFFIWKTCENVKSIWKTNGKCFPFN